MGCLLAVVLSLGALSPAAPPRQKDAEPEVETFGPKVKDDVLNAMTQIITERAFVPGVDFGKWNDLVSEIRDQVDSAKTPNEFTTAVNGALRKFGLSHIVLFSPKAAVQAQTGKMVGIGVRIQLEPEGIRVTRLFEGGPADLAGIQVGDLIVEGDGKPVRTPVDLAGEEGTLVSVKVKRGDLTKTFRIIRKSFSTAIPETLTWVESRTAMLTIPTFDRQYDAERVDDLMHEAAKADMLIVDVRGNSGGRVVNLLHLLGYLMPKGAEVGTFVEKRSLESFRKAKGREPEGLDELASFITRKVRPAPLGVEPFAGRIAVLIDGGTGSAAEMLAAALKEKRNAAIVGTKSAGAVLASLMWPIVHSYMLQYPVTDYVTSAGVRLEGHGVTPDVEAATPKFQEEDLGVQAALRLLKAGPDLGSG